MSERITLAELIAEAIESRLLDLHVAMPCKVTAYQASTQRCDCQPQLQLSVPDGTGGYLLETLPVLPNVPVCFPSGGGFFASFPLAVGDPVMVVFADRSIGAWLAKGEVCDPGDLHKHSLSGAVAYPGIKTTGHALASASGSNMVLGKDGTSAAQIELTGSEVHLGAGASDPVVTQKDLGAFMFALNAAIPTPNDGGAGLKTTLTTALTTAGWASQAGITQCGSLTTKSVR